MKQKVFMFLFVLLCVCGQAHAQQSSDIHIMLNHGVSGNSPDEVDEVAWGIQYDFQWGFHYPWGFRYFASDTDHTVFMEYQKLDYVTREPVGAVREFALERKSESHPANYQQPSVMYTGQQAFSMRWRVVEEEGRHPYLFPMRYRAVVAARLSWFVNGLDWNWPEGKEGEWKTLLAPDLNAVGVSLMQVPTIENDLNVGWHGNFHWLAKSDDADCPIETSGAIYLKVAPYNALNQRIETDGFLSDTYIQVSPSTPRHGIGQMSEHQLFSFDPVQVIYSIADHPAGVVRYQCTIVAKCSAIDAYGNVSVDDYEGFTFSVPYYGQ